MKSQALSLLLTLAVPAAALAGEDIERELDVLELDLRAEARLTWQAVSPLLDSGGLVAEDAVKAFLDEYEAARVCYQEQCRDVRTAEASQARAWLDEQTPAAPLDTSSPPASEPSREPATESLEEPEEAKEPGELQRSHVGLALEKGASASGVLTGPEISWHGRRIYGQIRLGMGSQPSGDYIDVLALRGSETKDTAEELRDIPWISAQLHGRFAVELAPDVFRLGIETRVWDMELFAWERLYEAGIHNDQSRGVEAGPYLAAGFLIGPVMVRFCNSYHIGIHNLHLAEDTQLMGESEGGELKSWEVMNHQLRTWVDATVSIGHFYGGLEFGNRTSFGTPNQWSQGLMDPSSSLLFSLRAGFAY